MNWEGAGGPITSMSDHAFDTLSAILTHPVSGHHPQLTRTAGQPCYRGHALAEAIPVHEWTLTALLQRPCTR